MDIIKKIDYASDFHLGFWAPYNEDETKWEKDTRAFAQSILPKLKPSNKEKQKKGEPKKLIKVETVIAPILILAGDFGESNKQTIWFIDELSKYYEYIIATYGNHDLYLAEQDSLIKYSNSYDRINELIEYYSKNEKVFFVANEILEINGIKFGVTPLWYNISSDISRHYFETTSNDYQYIVTGDIDNWVELHQKDKSWYDSLSDENIDIMVTHVPPVNIPGNTYPYREFFVTDVEELKAPNWVCGHQHRRIDFDKAGTLFHMNAFGYKGELPGSPKIHQFVIK